MDLHRSDTGTFSTMWQLRITTFCSVVKWRWERFEADIGLLAAGYVPSRSDRPVPAEAIQGSAAARGD
jgi:hypothetical protein